MELIDKIKDIVNGISTIKEPSFDLKVDNNSCITGTIRSKSFEDDRNWYKTVYSAIQAALRPDEVDKIKMIFLDSQMDLVSEEQDLSALGTDVKRHKYWYSPTPDKNRYLAIIDMRYPKTMKPVKVFYIVINPEYHFKENYLINYESKVIDFLELQGVSILDYAFDNAYNNVEAAIKFDLMKRQSKLFESGEAKWDNKYSYVNEKKFKIKPLNFTQAILTESEINQLYKIIKLKSLQQFKFISEVKKQIDFSLKLIKSGKSFEID